MFRKIMVPVDLDHPEIAAKALAVAKRIARLDGAELLIISVMPDPRDEAEEASMEARLEALVEAERGDLVMDGVLNLGGGVAREIREAAQEMGVDLVVMASHEPKLEDYLLGSRSARVALHSQCSVMVVR